MRACHPGLLVIATICTCFAAAATAQAVSGTPPTVSKGDVSFIQHAASDGNAEISLGQLALEKSSNDEVRKLAQRMIDDHTKTAAALKTLAHGKQVTLTTPSETAATDDSAFKNKVGARFDQAWTGKVVKDHQKAIANFTSEKRNAQDPDVRNFSEEALPMLDKHLDMARSLQDALALPDARDSAMDSHSTMGASTFAHVSTPANAASAANATTPPAPAPAPATSMGNH